MYSVAVSILNHGEPRPTIQCVRSVLAEQQLLERGISLAVWVADNGSEPSVLKVLQETFADLPAVTVLKNQANLGFAAGHNRNIRSILAISRPDFIWLLNNDCTIEPGCVDALLSCAAKSHGIGIWGATLLEEDGLTIQCAGGCFYNGWLSSFRQYAQGKPVSRRMRLNSVKFSYLAGASLFFPVGTLENGLGPPAGIEPESSLKATHFLNETFFLYFEELDLAQRLKPGLALGWCRDALITHKGGESTGAGSRQRSRQAEFHSTLSALKFTHLYYPRRLWFMAPARYAAKVLQLLVSGNARLLGSVNSAYGEFWSWLRKRA